MIRQMAATTVERALLLAVAATVAAVLLQYSTPADAAQASAGAQKSNNNNNNEFIRRSCSSTLYPSLCYTSLAPYADAVAQKPTQLAVVATNVSLARVRSVSSHVSSIRRASTDQRVDNRTACALKDCEESLGDAADLTGKAAGELGRLATAKGTEVAWRVGNAQTWMSAALTNEDTCMDGFADGTSTATSTAAGGEGAAAAASPTSSVEDDVCRRVRQVKQYTSNALALVNSLVGTNR